MEMSCFSFMARAKKTIDGEPVNNQKNKESPKPDKAETVIVMINIATAIKVVWVRKFMAVTIFSLSLSDMRALYHK